MTFAAALAGSLVWFGLAVLIIRQYQRAREIKAEQAALDRARAMIMPKVAIRHGTGHHIIPSAEWPKPYVRPSCYHYAVSPVRLVKTGELVAGICLDCNAEIGPELVPVRARAVRYVSDTIGMIILPVESLKKKIEAAIESGAFTINDKGL